MTMKKALFATLAAAVFATASMIAAQKTQEPAIGGYCPVAYLAANTAQKGDAKVTSTFDGQTFHLTNTMVKQMFDKEPAKYAPAYQGYCAAGVAKGMKLTSDPELFTVVDGKAYLFSTREAKQMFDADKASMIAMGKKNWPAVAKQAVTK